MQLFVSTLFGVVPFFYFNKFCGIKRNQMKRFLYNSCIVLLCSLIFSCKKNSDNNNGNNKASGPKAGSHWIWNEYTREDGQPEIKLVNELHWVARDSTVDGILGLAIYGATTPPGGDPQAYGLLPVWFIYNQGDITWKLKILLGSNDNGATDDSWLKYPDVPGGSYSLHNAWYPDNYTGHSFVSMMAKNYSPGDTVVTNPHDVWEMQKVYTEGGAQAVFTNYYTDNGPLLKQSIYRKNFNPPTNTDYEEHEYRLKSFTR